MTLGKYPDMTLKQAREKRDEYRAWLSQGLDPRIDNKLTKESLFTPMTIKNVLITGLKTMAREKRKETVCLYMTMLSNSTRWRMEQDGKFPRCIKIGPSAVAYRLSEIQAWIRGEWGNI